MPTKLLDSIAKICLMLKFMLISHDPTEQKFQIRQEVQFRKVEAILHAIESFNEHVVIDAYSFDDDDIQTILDETGIPAGWYPLIVGYDTLPTIPADLDLPLLPEELLDYLTTHKRISPNDKELAHIKASL